MFAFHSRNFSKVNCKMSKTIQLFNGDYITRSRKQDLASYSKISMCPFQSVLLEFPM